MSDAKTDSSSRGMRAGEPAGPGRPRVSVAMITRNEQANIADCLDSVAWADEVVVVDQASTDGTGDIARKLGARLINAPDWHGFGRQKQIAVDACTGDWILSLDADERVTPELATEIRAAIGTATHAAYRMPRRSSFCGRFIDHSGWSPDHVLRLFRRGTARFSEDRVHERLLASGPIGQLASPLLHYSFRTPEDVLDKVNRYSSESARMLHESGRAPGLASAVAHGIAAFVRTYFLKRGFLDGRRGFMLAVSNAEGSYYRYVKAMLLAEARGHPPESR